MTLLNTETVPPKPAPQHIEYELPYWEGARRHDLVLQRCRGKNIYLQPPMIGAPPWCAEAELEWVSLGSDILGTVYSFTVVHRAFNQSFAAELPYVVAMCDLAAAPGARVIANVVGVTPQEIRIGLELKMFWEDRDGGAVVPQWGPAAASRR